MFTGNLHPTIYAPTTECMSDETAKCCGNHTVNSDQTTDEYCCSIRDQVRCCINEENIDRLEDYIKIIIKTHGSESHGQETTKRTPN